MTTYDNHLERLIAEAPSLQSAVISIKATAPADFAPTSTSACLAKATIPESPAQTGGQHLNSQPPSLLRPLVLKGDQEVLRPLLNSEHIPHSQNCYPVATQRLLSLEHEPSLPDKTQPPPPRQEQIVSHAHLTQQLQQFVRAQKIILHSRTPVNAHHLYLELSAHPDQPFVKQLLHNLQYGCAIGYAGPQFSHCSNNLPSAFQQPSILDITLASECSAGRILGPFPSPPLPYLRCSGLGIIPKHDGGWRTIYHLSAPHGTSINDFIDPEQYSLSYCTVDDAFAIVNSLGKGALMAKIDLKNAFRIIPVRPEDWNLLGICWRNEYYIDTCLPFGLRSAPFLFNQLATAIHWILQHKYQIRHLLHYLDDFFTAGLPDSSECANNLTAMLSLCENINAPVKSSKIEGPSTHLSFLGIIIDTTNMQASISEQRKQDLLSLLSSFKCRKKCTKQELLSLIGKLSFACKVIPAGRIFLRRLIDTSCSVSRLHHHIRLNEQARLDIEWWLTFLPTWNGTSYILETEWSTSTSMSLYTDASSSIGWGAYWSGRWIQSHWSSSEEEKSIVWKELFAVTAAVNTWGHLWARKKVLFHCDNQAVVDIWRTGTTKSPDVMALIRMLYFCAATHNIHVIITHVAGVNNAIADALSRFQVNRFRQLAPHAEMLPDTIPAWPARFLKVSSAITKP